jgi:hypothetical protein
LGLGSCKEDEPDLFNNTKGSYLSIKKYAIDEWRNHIGDMVAFKKTVTLNGKTDSSYTNVLKMDWAEITKVFFETDISDHKFLGKYNFNQFDDDDGQTHNFFYIAKEKDLYTQRFLITMDANSGLVKGIYIKTIKKSFWNEQEQQLTYLPFRSIMIQQYDKPLIGKKKELVIKYQATNM